jgi:hypothetical protein
MKCQETKGFGNLSIYPAHTHINGKKNCMFSLFYVDLRPYVGELTRKQKQPIPNNSHNGSAPKLNNDVENLWRHIQKTIYKWFSTSNCWFILGYIIYLMVYVNIYLFYIYIYRDFLLTRHMIHLSCW